MLPKTLTPEELEAVVSIIDTTEPEELIGFEPHDSGDAEEDDYLNGRARVRTFFRLNCEEGLVPVFHLIATFDRYHVGDLRALLKEAVRSGEFNVSFDLEPGFVFFERSEILRLITSRTDLTPGYLCEILTENDPRRDVPTQTERPIGYVSTELHLPAWLLADMLAAARERWLEVKTDRRFIWREPVEQAS
jgi:hypothetical protein